MIEFVHPEIFLAFPLRVCTMRIMVNNHYCHVFPFLATHIKMFPDGLLHFFGLYGRAVVVDLSAEVTCFTNVLLWANSATDEIGAIVCAARLVARYLEGATHDEAFKTVRVGAVLVQKASDIRTCLKTSIFIQICSHWLRLIELF